jgi:hypothetical protein
VEFGFSCWISEILETRTTQLEFLGIPKRLALISGWSKRELEVGGRRMWLLGDDRFGEGVRPVQWRSMEDGGLKGARKMRKMAREHKPILVRWTMLLPCLGGLRLESSPERQEE